MSERRQTLASLFVLAASAVTIALAIWLDPNPQGVGTHTQLGLQPCVLMSTLGLPCPMCGMTTTFSLMADLRPVAAFLNQPLGAALFVVTVGVAIISAIEIASPRERWSIVFVHLDRHKPTYLVLFSVMFFGSWFYKIIIMNEISH